MDARFYNSDEIDIERLAGDLVNVYMAQGYQTQQIGGGDQILVQLKKGSDFEAILGMQAAVSLTLQRTGGGVLAMIGQQRWLDKAAVGTIGIVAFPVLWPLALTAGAGALRQASLGNQVLNMVDGLIRQQRPNIQVGPIPMHLLPQVQQRWGQPSPSYQQTPSYVPQYVPPQTIVSAVPPAALPAATLRCPQCNTPYEVGDTFCSGCGRSLIPQKVYCNNCNTELKAGVAFCPKCGASTYQAFADAQKEQGKPVAQAATPTVTYTPPTPPAQPPTPKRDEGYYVPSIQPTVEAYTPPKPVAPTPPVQPVQPTPPPEVRYVPPVTQAPSVAPQPSVTYTQATPSTPKPTPPAPKREEVYYVPSPQAVQPPTVSAKAQPQQPIAAKPAAQPAVDANTQWGTLTFSDGTQVTLQGERALVGRYDHDIGGVQPEVDLANVPGADTVSRIHAAFEHVGSTYTLTDLNSTNSTRINGKRLEPDKATPINDGDTLYFGKVSSTFKKK